MATIAITCPNCGFSREQHEGSIPTGFLKTTCPRCGESFSFRKSEAEAEAAAKSARRQKPRTSALKYAICAIFILAVIGAVLYLVMPRMRTTALFKGGDALKALLGKTGPVSLTAPDYDKLLALQKISFGQGTGMSVGPAALALANFWNDPESPHVWLKVRTAAIPNLALDRKMTRVTISRVLNRENRDIYDAASPLEGEFFQRLAMHPAPEAPLCLEEVRDIHLRKGTSDKDVAAVEGTLELSLPEKAEAINLDAARKTGASAAAGVQMTVNELAGRKVSLTYLGDFSRHIRTIAYGRGSAPLPEKGSSWGTAGNTTRMNLEFDGDVQSVTVLVGSGFIQRKYPFTLKR